MNLNFDTTKMVEEIVMQATENQEEFIFETIRPYCEDILQMKINKKELKQILLKQQPCEDCISRADVLDLAKKGVLISNSNYQSVCKAINELPSVTPTRKKMMWEFEKSIFDGFGLTVICPSCRKRWKTYDEIRWKKENRFCPNCGTEMEVQE